jgi:hypothetical protein
LKFQVNKPIRLIELFSGVGFTRMALEAVVGRGGYESWRTCEWDVNAMRSYAAIHCYDDTKDYSEPLSKAQLIEYLITLNLSTDGKKPLTKQQVGRKGEKWLRETYNNIQRTDNICDISQALPEDLWIEDTKDFVYFLTYSFPCFTGDTLILTADGYKKITDVQPGDTVMCHDAQFHKVIASKKTGTKEIYEVSGMTTDKIRCTENHKFYVRKMYHKYR